MGWWIVPLPDPDRGDETFGDAPAEGEQRFAPLDRDAARSFVASAYDQLQRDVHSFATHATRDADVAADVTQEAFIRLLTEAERHGPPVHLKAWLLRVAANLAISRGRRISVADRWVQRFGRSSAATESPEVGYLQQEHRDRVRQLLQEVSPDARVGLLLAAEGFSGREIAAALGRSELATRALLCRARTRLRDLLTSEGDVPRIALDD